MDPSVSVAVAEGSGSKGSLSVGILVGIIVGAVAVVFLIGAGAFAAWRSAFRTKCDGGNGTADQKARQFRPEFLALDAAYDAGTSKISGMKRDHCRDTDGFGLDSAMVFPDKIGGKTTVFCPSAAPAMLVLPHADPGLSVELGHVDGRRWSIIFDSSSDLEIHPLTETGSRDCEAGQPWSASSTIVEDESKKRAVICDARDALSLKAEALPTKLVLCTVLGNVLQQAQVPEESNRVAPSGWA